MSGRDRGRVALALRSPAVWGAVIFAFALISGCAGGGGRNGAERAERPNPVELSPPPVAARSPKFGIPLPEGAQPDSGRVSADSEVFAVAAPVTFADVNAFYRREMERKPFQDYEWCGQRAEQASKTLIRIWQRPGTKDYLILALHNDNPSEPTIIDIDQRAGVVVDACSVPAG